MTTLLLDPAVPYAIVILWMQDAKGTAQGFGVVLGWN